MSKISSLLHVSQRKTATLFWALALLAVNGLMWFSVSTASADPKIINGVEVPVSALPDPPAGAYGIVGTIFVWLLMMFGFVSIGAFVLSGIQYLIAAGSDDMIKTAKRNMTWSLVGVIVGLSGYIVMMAVNNALSGNPYF